ncbi:hypothetical protein HDU97_009324 [Phlyctochytrium planicorne]|nr:hypothetical protein HDU97_009324 [Phlyctochytrium planicorne]
MLSHLKRCSFSRLSGLVASRSQPTHAFPAPRCRAFSSPVTVVQSAQVPNKQNLVNMDSRTSLAVGVGLMAMSLIAVLMSVHIVSLEKELKEHVEQTKGAFSGLVYKIEVLEEKLNALESKAKDAKSLSSFWGSK